MLLLGLRTVIFAAINCISEGEYNSSMLKQNTASSKSAITVSVYRLCNFFRISFPVLEKTCFKIVRIPQGKWPFLRILVLTQWKCILECELKFWAPKLSTRKTCAENGISKYFKNSVLIYLFSMSIQLKKLDWSMTRFYPTCSSNNTFGAREGYRWRFPNKPHILSFINTKTHKENILHILRCTLVIKRFHEKIWEISLCKISILIYVAGKVFTVCPFTSLYTHPKSKYLY